MQSFPMKIVTAVDGSEESTKAALFSVSLAKSSGAALIGLHVMHLPEYVSDDAIKRMRSELSAKGDAALKDAKSVAESQSISMSTKLLETTSSVVDAICNFASAEGADLIVLGTRGTGGMAKLMLGSVAVGVARSARCPVLVAR